MARKQAQPTVTVLDPITYEIWPLRSRRGARHEYQDRPSRTETRALDTLSQLSAVLRAQRGDILSAAYAMKRAQAVKRDRQANLAYCERRVETGWRKSRTNAATIPSLVKKLGPNDIVTIAARIEVQDARRELARATA